MDLERCIRRRKNNVTDTRNGRHTEGTDETDFFLEPGSLSVVELDIRRASMPDTALERREA